jgi:hypothetical protein
MIEMLFGFSMFLIHLLAWPCGSIMSGQRLAFLEEVVMKNLEFKNGRQNGKSK